MSTETVKTEAAADQSPVKEKKKFFDATVLSLLREIRPLSKWIALSAFLCLILIGCAVAEPELLGNLVDRLYDWTKTKTPGLAKSMLPGIGLLLLVYVLRSGLAYLNGYLLQSVISHHFCAALRIRISDKLRRLPVSFMDRTPAGDIIDRMMDDVSDMAGSIHGIIEVLIQGFLQILIITILLFLTDWHMAIPVVLLCPLSILLSVKMASLGEKNWDSHYDLAGQMTSLAEEAYTNYPTTKAFNCEEILQKKYEDLAELHRKKGEKCYFVSSVVSPVIAFLNALAYIAVAVIGGWLVIHRGISVGTVVTIILFARRYSEPLENMAFSIGYFQHIKSAAKRVFTVLDLPEENNPAGKVTPPVKGQVEFCHVDFSYKPDKPLIHDLNFLIRPGQKVAIVGPTGAGKTTIVNLLMRFYDIERGRILIDGRDVSELSREENRNLFAMVLQDTWLFHGTVAENIAFGNPEASREEIERTCKLAYCDHFIRSLPKGYDTEISEDSTAVSSGQKQLLTIARALLSDRPLLILDEATSNVDTRTELLIQKAMDRLMGDRTCFVIAHRLSTIVNADLILVIRDGKIVEQGTHASLLAEKGFYYDMYQSQYAI